MTTNPNTVTVQARGARSASRRSGNRIDRIAEKAWISQQAAVIPYGVAPALLSLFKTFYARALFLGACYLGRYYFGVLPPGGMYIIWTLYVIWEFWIALYLWGAAQIRRDVFIRSWLALFAIGLVYLVMFEGVCGDWVRL